MERFAKAHWEGPIKEGKGRISTHSDALHNEAYSFGTRFESQSGTNPEELIGAAHAACFSMALSQQLEQAGMNPERIDTGATVSLTQQGEAFSISKIHLDLEAKIPGADQAKFDEAAEAAKNACPVSKLLNADITLSSQLHS